MRLFTLYFYCLLPTCLNYMLQMYTLVMNGFAFHFWTLCTCYRFPNLKSNCPIEPKPSKILLESFKSMVGFPASIFITCCLLNYMLQNVHINLIIGLAFHYCTLCTCYRCLNLSTNSPIQIQNHPRPCLNHPSTCCNPLYGVVTIKGAKNIY